jgi:SIR2-like domain
MTNAQVLNEEQPGGMTHGDWQGLLYAIRHKECTPFLGAGACAGVLPLGNGIARAWAEEYEYPFPDDWNLVRVAQYVAVITRHERTPKFRIIEEFKNRVMPNFANPNEPHMAVSGLRLPVYITTNYDDFMFQAILYDEARRVRRDPDYKPRRPRQAVCKWHLARQRKPPSMDLDFEPTEEEPVIFHLHGQLDDAGSMVVTEDDYLDFLMNISETQDLIPPRIQGSFGGSAFIFLGYSLEDMNFKVLFRKLAPYMHGNVGVRHVSVQLAPREDQSIPAQVEQAKRQREYLETHFDLQNVKIYWGTCEQFAAELLRRREVFNRDR